MLWELRPWYGDCGRGEEDGLQRPEVAQVRLFAGKRREAGGMGLQSRETQNGKDKLRMVFDAFIFWNFEIHFAHIHIGLCILGLWNN